MQDILPSNGETERGREHGSSRSRALRSRSPRPRSISRSRTRSRSPRKSRSTRRHRRRSYSKTSSSRSRSRSKDRRRRSPIRSHGSRDRSRGRRRASRRDEPEPSHVLGVFNLSLRTTEKDLQNIFERYGRVNNVTIVYDHRSDRSRGFGFVYMNSIDESTIAKDKTNGMELNGRNMRVDYSLTQRPHTPTPGEYMGDRPRYRTSYSYRRTPSVSPTRFRRKSPTRSKSRSWSRDKRRSHSRSYSKRRSFSRARRSRSYSH
ncbi:10442_t:CDS:2 [Funneliformis mosseae]|uniref:10442_t:CDS:1 n=1 Tax=Funneliformis mosseae TaxID=27381 RepID=A0A9N9C6E8_FUNMO|nr:10442_t:CDS:2 [Funneliformis mosseae]